MPDLLRCQFSEGWINLPAGYQDRTVNVFTQPAEQQAASLNITRGQLKSGQTLSLFVDEQLQVMRSNIQGWELSSRQTIALGSRAIAAEQIAITFLVNRTRLWQQQAMCALNDGQILVFTLSKAQALSDQDQALWQQWLGSFTPTI
jgi:hypothetical protein